MKSNSTPARILVGVDGSASSIEALRGAANIAKAMNAYLQVVVTWEYPSKFYPVPGWSPEKEALELLSSSLSEAFGADLPEGLQSAALDGPTAHVLIEQSESADLLVLGSRGHGGFAGLLLGSVSTACAQHARCPVLIMHRANDSKITGSAHSSPDAPANT